MNTSMPWDKLRCDPALSRLRDLSTEGAALAQTAKLDLGRFPALSDPDWLDRVLHRTSSTFTIIVIGQVSSGKSSFINSLFGRKLLLPSDKPTDGVVSVLLPAEPGVPEYAEKVFKNGTVERFDTLDCATTFLRQQDTPIDQQMACREVRLYLHDPWLRHLRIVNTPGLGDRLQAFGETTQHYLHEDESDLVVWTFFPEAAANSDEIGIFAQALARRRNDVLGVVTRCLEGKEDDRHYDPEQDPSLAGGTGVRQWLTMNLGQYLREVIFYDSHVSRRLVQQMRSEPQLQSDAAFITALERTGYAKFQRTLTSILGADRNQVHRARATSVLKRCSGHARNMAAAAEAAEQVFLQQANAEHEQVQAWQRVENEIIGPLRLRFKDQVRELAMERSKELATIMGNSAVDAIEENFGLLGTLGRSMISWTGMCDSASDALNKRISDAVDAAIARAHFYERLNEAMQRLTKEQLLALECDLCRALEFQQDNKGGVKMQIDPGRPAGRAGDVMGNAISGALKGVVTAILKSLASKLEERAALEAAKEMAGQAAKRAATKAGQAAAKQAAQKGAGAATARAAGIVTLVLIPFDIAKLVKDFNKGRESLAETVRIRYQTDRPTYDLRVFDTLWPLADDALSSVLEDARAALDERQGAKKQYMQSAQRASTLRRSLIEMADQFVERANGRQ